MKIIAEKSSNYLSVGRCYDNCSFYLLSRLLDAVRTGSKITTTATPQSLHIIDMTGIADWFVYNCRVIYVYDHREI